MKKSEIEKLANLARISVSDKEKEDLVKDIGDILKFVDEVQSAKIDDSTESRVGVLYNVMREDDPPAGGVHESGAYSGVLMSAAPNSEKGYIKVKKIL